MTDLVVIGGGPAGLSAAHEAVSHSATVAVFERLAIVGGLARTIAFEGSRFDVGPHRFFTKNTEVHQLFTSVLGEDLIHVRRQTRILNQGTFFDYPLTPLMQCSALVLRRGIAIAGSYAGARIRALASQNQHETFEDWIVDRFGRRLYELFFKGYTEKVWGVPCAQIGADWAAQRIKGLSLSAAIRNAVSKNRRKTIKTLVDEFLYPRLGAGHLYEKMASAITREGGNGHNRRQGHGHPPRGNAYRRCDGRGAVGSYDVIGKFFLTSLPVTDLIEMMNPEPPSEVTAAARALRYREHIGVNLLVEGRPFPDNWIYVHSPEVAMARIANYRNFSPEMAGSDNLSPLTVEYFASPGDALSRASDAALVDRAVGELQHIGVMEPDQLRGAS